MQVGRLRAFLCDEDGAYTIWSLLWFTLYIALGGLAVDFTDAYRTRTQLQATADAAALAGVMSLPDEDEAVAMAVAVGQLNLPVDPNGHVVHPQEVWTGNWNGATDTFTINGSPKNAVYVLARRDDSHQNPLPTNFLRIAGFGRFEVNVDAVAVKFVPPCITENGLLANNRIDVTSNNGFNSICMHAQNVTADPGQDYAIDLGNGNVFNASVQVSMSDLNDLNGRPNVCTNNTGLCDPGTLKEGDMWAKDAEPAVIQARIDGLRALDPKFLPGYMFDELPADDPARDDGVTTNGPIVEVIDESYNGPYLPYRVYIANCSSKNKILSLPATLLDRVVIVATCQIHSSSNGTIVSSVLATDSVGNGQDELAQTSISLPNGWTIGSVGFCDGTAAPVEMYAKASAKIVAENDTYGLRVVVGGDLEFTANGNVQGISAEANDSITATANGQWTYCGGTFDLKFADHYRLVR